MKIVSEKQYDSEWYIARRGVPTASNAKNILTPGGKPSVKGRQTYINQLIGELYDSMYGLDEGPKSKAMERGTQMEPEARDDYSFLHIDADIQEVGFCLDDANRFGCSPDALVDDDGVIEIKCPMIKTVIEWLRAGVLPKEHWPQVHMTLVVTGRKWLDFMAYAPGTPKLIIRVEPNEYTKKMRTEMAVFWEEFQAAKQLIEDMTPKETS